MTRSIIIHGHFYQPPREDPWLEEFEAEPSAAPFHDWNQRIEQECYRAIVAARVPGPEGHIARILNALAWMSFNFGPTLLEWLEREAPATYAAVLEADRQSVHRLGHGNAIAMPYHHAIMPLSSRRDKITEVRWGIADFERRFGRRPEGMWLPEAAVDHETLEVLAAEGILFTVLGPDQVRRKPAHGLPGLYQTRGGRTLTVFVYDGPLSHDVAFGPLVHDAQAWAVRLLAPEADGSSPQLVSIATDGETYGHHHKFGEMALARVLEDVRGHPEVRLENFASFLAREPPTEEIEPVSPSSWSCPHGVERWRSDCGCRILPERETQQRWRAPLRDAINWLAAELHAIFERDGAHHFDDPWRVRDGYGTVVGAGAEEARRYVAAQVAPGADAVRAGELLELERGALRTFTSCAWFFDDLGGIETLQVLRYAARAIELTGRDAGRLEEGFGQRLAPATSNDRTLGNGQDLFRRHAKPEILPAARIAAGLAAAGRFAPEAASTTAYLWEGADSAVTLVHRRTGQRQSFGIEMAHQHLGLSVEVSGPALSAAARLDLADLPERQRTALERAFRAELVALWLTEAERRLLALGAEPLVEVIRMALVRSVAVLERDRSSSALARALDLATLYENLGRYAPFEAQTLFYRVWASAPAAEAEALAPLARTLGFVDHITRLG